MQHPRNGAARPAALEIEPVQSWALECHAPEGGAAQSQDLLFLHGMAAGSWVWTPDWIARFTARGYRCWTMTLPGREGGASLATDPAAFDRILKRALEDGDAGAAIESLSRALPGASLFDGPDLDDFSDALAEALAAIDRPAVVVSHSLGGAVAQNLLRRGGRPAGNVLICSAPPYGLWRPIFNFEPNIMGRFAGFFLNIGLSGQQYRFPLHLRYLPGPAKS